MGRIKTSTFFIAGIVLGSGLQTGGGGSSATQLTSGGFWPNGPMDKNANAFSFPVGSANRVQCSEFIQPYPGFVVSVVKAFVFAGTGSMEIGVFDSSGSLLANSSTVTAPGETVNNFTLSTTLLAGALYSICYTSNQSADQFFGPNAAFVTDIANNGTSGAGLHVYFCSNPSTTMAGTTLMPATCGTRTSPGNSGANGLPAFYIGAT